MNAVGHHNEGIRFGNEALETFKPVLGDDHESVLKIQRNIALILQAEGLFDKALPIFQNIHSKANSLFKEDSDLLLLIKHDLGNALRKSGRQHEGQQVLKEVLGKSKVIYGDNHENALIVEQNYGLALMEDGKFSEAEEIFQRILKIYVEKGSENSTNVLQLQSNRSVIYSEKGNFEKALGICREVYEKLTPVWMENVELFANVICNLGGLLMKIKKFEEALEILEGNIEKIKKPLGSKHLHILDIKKRIGKAYHGLENHNRAIEILKSVHLDFISLFGEDSLRALLANCEVAVTLSCMGQHSEAISKFSEIILKMDTLFTNESWDVLTTKWDFAKAIENSGENFPMALDLLLTVKLSLKPFVGNKLAPGEEALLTNAFLRILNKIGDLDNAMAILQDILPKAKLLLGEDSEFYLETKEKLGNALARNKTFMEAKQIFQEVLAKKEQLFGRDHLSTLRCKMNYGIALMVNGKWNKADKIFQLITEMCLQSEVKNVINMWELQNDLAYIYFNKGHYGKSLEIFGEIYKNMNPVWNENVDFFAHVCYDLGITLNNLRQYCVALIILEGNIEKLKERLNSPRKTILNIQQEIGRAYHGLENYSKAHEILESVHQDFVSLSGQDSLNALNASKDVAVTLSCLGQHAEALSKFRQIIPKMETLFGKESWDLLIAKWKYADAIERSDENLPMALYILLTIKTSMTCFVGKEMTPDDEAFLTNDIIRLLKKIGDLENATSILQDILPKAKLLLGEDSKFYLETKEELGYALVQDKKFKEAEQMLEEVLAKKEKLLGKDHLSTLRCRMNYGKALMKNGNLDEADKIFQLIREICSQKDDINVWDLQNNLACIYSDKGHHGKCLEIFREVYEKLNPVWNEQVGAFAIVCYNVGETLNAVGKHEEALEILEGNIKKIKELLGNQHKIILLHQQEMGYTYQCLGNFKKAHEILQSVHQSFVSLSEEESKDALEALYNVAMSLFEMGVHATAFSKFREALPGLEALLGKEDLGVIIKKRDFALAIARSGENLQTALDFLKSTRTSMSSIIGEDSEYVETISSQIEAIEKKIKGFDEATSILQDYLPKAQSKYGEDTEPFLEIKEKLGNTLIRNGKYKEAQKILGEVLGVREIILGEDHSLTLATRVSFGKALMDDGKLKEAQDIFQKITNFYLERGDENNKNMLKAQICLDLIYIRKEVFDSNT